MITPALTSSLKAYREPYAELKRKNLAPCPLGAIGNLQFSAKQGGTARASHLSVEWPILRQTTVNGITGLMTALIHLNDSDQQRKDDRAADHRDHLLRVRVYSTVIGDLLGQLTAEQSDVKTQLRAAALLQILGQQSHGDIDNITGCGYSLWTYTDELTDSDVMAMVTGALRHSNGVAAILDKMPPGDLRTHTFQLLEQIDAAVERRRMKGDVKDSLEQISTLLLTHPIDKLKLKKSLISVAQYLDACTRASLRLNAVQHLHVFLQSLPKERLQPLLPLAQREKLEECLEALGTNTVNGITRGREILHFIHQSLVALQAQEPISQ